MYKIVTYRNDSLEVLYGASGLFLRWGGFEMMELAISGLGRVWSDGACPGWKGRGLMELYSGQERRGLMEL